MSGRAILLLSALTGRAVANCAYGTTLHPRAEDGVKIGNFGYNGLTGPTNWLGIDEANIQCAVGTRQSPVDMVAGAFPRIAGTAINLQIPDIAETEFENLGTTVEVVANQGGTMTIPDVGDFKLQQFHFHLPSEHLDNGTSQAMEMHMVWEGAENASSVAVLSAYIGLVGQNGAGSGAGTSQAATVAGAVAAAKKRQDESTGTSAEGAPASTAASGATVLLETVLNTVDQIATPGTAIKTPALVMSELVNLLTSGEFQQYTGSLTTPPCTEGVNWLVATQKLTIEPATFAKVRDVVGFNARFPQNKLGETNLLQVSAQSIGSPAPGSGDGTPNKFITTSTGRLGRLGGGLRARPLGPLVVLGGDIH
ncbi:tat pathway signal sequence [Niveomyces insectorum RCEF 264]|uniref:carbonic anhydrase n=1 Tax=Niveomyces insectorum RCEF 264 TaxID=1081102 RepID=A0A167MMS0_9HYPO|nr:tat pathway signal sequence [Niveomyces insectorum RCEF 264]